MDGPKGMKQAVDLRDYLAAATLRGRTPGTFSLIWCSKTGSYPHRHGRMSAKNVQPFD